MVWYACLVYAGVAVFLSFHFPDYCFYMIMFAFWLKNMRTGKQRSGHELRTSADEPSGTLQKENPCIPGNPSSSQQQQQQRGNKRGGRKTMHPLLGLLIMHERRQNLIITCKEVLEESSKQFQVRSNQAAIQYRTDDDLWCYSINFAVKDTIAEG